MARALPAAAPAKFSLDQKRPSAFLLNDSVGAQQQLRRNIYAKSPRCFQVNNEIKVIDDALDERENALIKEANEIAKP